MKTACFIPIKAFSERVQGKNFRKIGGEPIYQIIIDKVLNAKCFDRIFVDTNSDEIIEYSKKKKISVIKRLPELAENTANGNDLLVHQFSLNPDFSLYFQLFATAPFLKVDTIINCVNKLVTSKNYDSIFTAIAHQGYFWWFDQPINYQPGVLPRSQDLVPVMEETTALYGITHDSLNKYRARIGAKPYIYNVSKIEALDLNTDEDFTFANWFVKKQNSNV